MRRYCLLKIRQPPLGKQVEVEDFVDLLGCAGRTPITRPNPHQIKADDVIVSKRILGGLHHEYSLQKAAA
jgi:hypothetical protein